jgi:hypothetical protein
MIHRGACVPLLAAAALAGAAACGTDPDELGRCDPPLAMRVTSTPALEFSWGPTDCDVHTLSLLKGQTVEWYLFTLEDRNGLQSPIRYGVVPAGAGASDTAALFAGAYTVQLTRFDQAGLERVVATQEFHVE